MLASLKFVEKFISLPKIKKPILINDNQIEIETFDTKKITPFLTKQGFEVENIIIKGSGLEKVVVGRIEKIDPHPNASKLQICQVNVGEKQLRQIVCGAKNAQNEMYVAVALPSVLLPNGMEIKESKIREINSQGMLCSREELGLPINKETDGDGIWEISQDNQGGVHRTILSNNIGKPVFEVLEISDVLLDLSVTPNRPDMLCHQGIARELQAAFTYAGIPFETRFNAFFSKKINISEEIIKADAINNSSANCSKVSISVENNLDIPAFFVLIDSIEVRPSPAWIRNLLENLGQNSINNIVDASNYLLLAHGQPSHAFDLDKISSYNQNEKKLVLRKAKKDEKFIGLDGKDRILNEMDDIISDVERAHSILGVLGGEYSKVSSSTNKIIIEFANPNPVSVRRTSRRHARQTESSFMFEKGINEFERFQAAAEFFAIVSDYQENKPNYCGSFHSLNEKNIPKIKAHFPKMEIEFSSQAQEKIIGSNIISFEMQLKILESLGFELSNITTSSAKVTVPSWRSHDIVGEADLVEEFIRIVGIDTIPSIPFISPANVNYDDIHYKYIEKICSRSAALGYNEVISLHFMRIDDYEKMLLPSINSLGEPIALMNPILGDEPILHTTLIPDLLRKVSRNIGYGTKSGQLFHSCRTFQNHDNLGERVFKNNGESIGILNKLSQEIESPQDYHYSEGYAYTHEKSQKARPVETPRLAGVAFGNKTEKTWQNTSETVWTLHDIMSHLTEICLSIGIDVVFLRIASSKHKNDVMYHPIANTLHPGKSIGIYVHDENNNLIPIGWAGELHPKVMRNYEIDTPCFIFELNIATLIRFAEKPKQIHKKYATTLKFPIISRDFAFLFNENLSANQLIDTIENSLHNIISKEIPAKLQKINIFDIYKGKGIPENKKSVAFNVSLIPLERTLTEKDIFKISNTVIDAVTKNLAGELRG